MVRTFPRRTDLPVSRRLLRRRCHVAAAYAPCRCRSGCPSRPGSGDRSLEAESRATRPGRRSVKARDALAVGLRDLGLEVPDAQATSWGAWRSPTEAYAAAFARRGGSAAVASGVMGWAAYHVGTRLETPRAKVAQYWRRALASDRRRVARGFLRARSVIQMTPARSDRG